MIMRFRRALFIGSDKKQIHTIEKIIELYNVVTIKTITEGKKCKINNLVQIGKVFK